MSEDVRYDPEADAVSIRVAPGTVARTEALDDDRILDYAADGAVVEIELLSVSRGVDLVGLPHAEEVARALAALGIAVADPVAAANERAELRARDVFARGVADAVKSYRVVHGLTHRALGARVGMAGSDVARLERGAHAPSIDLLERLARALGLRFVVEVGPAAAAALALPPELVVLEEWAAGPDGSRVRVAAGPLAPGVGPGDRRRRRTAPVADS